MSIKLWTAGSIATLLLMGCEAPSTLTEKEAALVNLGKLKVMARGEAKNPALSEAHVTINKVQIRSAKGKFLTFTEQDFDLDLYHLDASVPELLARARMPDGLYDEIRLITADLGYVVTADQHKFDLHFPSGPQSGIKIFLNHPIEVKNGKISKVSLVFDLTRSFVHTGNDCYYFRPVIRAEGKEYTDKDPDGLIEDVDTEPENNECEEDSDDDEYNASVCTIAPNSGDSGDGTSNTNPTPPATQDPVTQDPSTSTSNTTPIDFGPIIGV